MQLPHHFMLPCRLDALFKTPFLSQTPCHVTDDVKMTMRRALLDQEELIVVKDRSNAMVQYRTSMAFDDTTPPLVFNNANR